MSWIKVRTNLFTDGRVLYIAAKTGVTRQHAVGALVAFWGIADSQSVDGWLADWSAAAMDAECATPGFCAAMADKRWIRIDADGLQVLKFSEHNGKSAKQRAQGALRSLTHRVTRASRSERYENVTRGEERREEEKREEPPPSPPKGERPRPARAPKVEPGATEYEALLPGVSCLRTQDFAEAWYAWLADRRERRKPVTALGAKEQLKILTEMGHDAAIAAVRRAIANGWTGIWAESAGNGRHGPEQPTSRIPVPPGKYDGIAERHAARVQANYEAARAAGQIDESSPF